MGLGVLVLVGGCLGFEDWEDVFASEGEGDKEELPALGLGLEVPEELPDPAPFTEDKKEIEKLEAFLLEDGREILEACGGLDRFDRIEDAIEDEQHLGAFRDIRAACDREVTQEPLGRIVTDAQSSGNESEVYEDLYEAAVGARAELAERINESYDRMGSHVDVQVVTEIGNVYQYFDSAMNKSSGYWEVYESGERQDRLQLENAYLNMIATPPGAEAMVEVLERYPWSDGICEVPDREALVERTKAKQEAAWGMAEEMGDPEHWYLGSMRGDLNYWIRQLPLYVGNGWWGNVLEHETKAEVQLAYWENVTAEAWPTVEEAEYLLAEHRNETRSLWTEEFLSHYMRMFEDEAFADGVEWYTHWHNDPEPGAALSLAELAVAWPFEAVDCSKAGSR